MTVSDELRQAAQHIRETARCAIPREGCGCDLTDVLATAFETQAVRGERVDRVDTYLLTVARQINATHPTTADGGTT